MFNKKGQAFSVFNLLIAAVVSMGILVLLLSVMDLIDFSANTDPTEVASTKLQTAQSRPGTPQTDTITFTSKANIVTKIGLSNNLNISPSQIHFVKEDSMSILNIEGNTLLYTGTSNLKVNIMAVCGNDTSQLKEIVELSSARTNFTDFGNIENFGCYLVFYPFTG